MDIPTEGRKLLTVSGEIQLSETTLLYLHHQNHLDAYSDD